MIKINLVPGEILAKAQQRQRALQLGFVGAAVAFLIVLASLGFVARLHRLENELSADKGKLKKLQTVVDQVNEKDAIAKALKARLKVIDDLDRGRRAYPYFMSDFVRCVPAGVRIKSLDTTGGATSPLKLTISAEARTYDDIRTWVRQMEDMGRFSNIEIGAVSTQDSAVGTLRSFTLTAAHTPQL